MIKQVLFDAANKRKVKHDSNRFDLNIGHNLNEMFSERIFVLCIDNIIFISLIYAIYLFEY